MLSGDHQNTSQKPKRKKTKKLSQKEQSRRFVETARKLEADETGEAFLDAVQVIIPPRQSSS